MSRYVLDTDILSLYRRDHPAVVAKVRACRPQDLSISIITVDEQLTGWYSLTRKAKMPAQVAHAYERLARSVTFLALWQILPFQVPAIDRFNQMKKMKLGMRANDLRIAAIALEHSATVVSRNVRDFQRVPGLQVEDWSA